MTSKEQHGLNSHKAKVEKNERGRGKEGGRKEGGKEEISLKYNKVSLCLLPNARCFQTVSPLIPVKI